MSDCGCIGPITQPPFFNCCPQTNIPGPPGQTAQSPLISNLAVPANTSTPVAASFTSTAWMQPGQTIQIGDQNEGHASFFVQAVTSGTMATLLWQNQTGDAVSGTTFTTSNGAYAVPAGQQGVGFNGINAFTALTSSATTPGDLITPVTFVVANSQWVTVGQTIVVGDAVDGVGTFRVTGIPDSTHITAVFLNARGDVAFGTTFFTANGATVSPTGSPNPVALRAMNATTSPTLFENSGSGATNLMTTVVPAGTLVNAGDSFEIEAVFTLPTAAAGKVITLQFGGTTIITVTTSQNGGSLIFRARVVRLTANTQIFYGTSQLSGGTASGNYTTGAINLAVSQSVICIGTGSNSGDIIQQVQMVRAATL